MVCYDWRIWWVVSYKSISYRKGMRLSPKWHVVCGSRIYKPFQVVEVKVNWILRFWPQHFLCKSEISKNQWFQSFHLFVFSIFLFFSNQFCNPQDENYITPPILECSELILLSKTSLGHCWVSSTPFGIAFRLPVQF